MVGRRHRRYRTVRNAQFYSLLAHARSLLLRTRQSRLLNALTLLGLSSLLSHCGLMGGPANDHTEATATLIPTGIIQINPANILSTNPSEPFLSGFSLQSLGETHFVLTDKPCDGAAGSLLPPIAITACTSSVVLSPLWVFGDTYNAIREQMIGAAAPELFGRTISLPGLEQFFVHQEQDNLCWAAALETARKYLKLHYLPQTEMINLVAGECTALQKQTVGAEMFQIAYTIAKINRVYDGDRLKPQWCSTERCIINTISRRRPVIALIASHAVLIQAIEVDIGATDTIKRYYILDPAKDGKIERKEAIEMCTAAGFIAL